MKGGGSLGGRGRWAGVNWGGGIGRLVWGGGAR